MRVNISEFDGNTLNPKGFIDWLVTVEEVFEFREVPEKKRVPLIATKLRGRASVWWQQLKLTRERVEKSRVTDWVKMKKLLMENFIPHNYQQLMYQRRRAIGKKTLFIDMEEDDEEAGGEYDKTPVYDEEPEYKEEYVSGDVGVSLVVRRSCFTPKADGDNWLRHNIFQSTCTISGKVCTFVCDSGSCDNLIAAEAVQKLELKTKDHLKPYKLQWLRKGGEMTVSKRVHVTFSVGKTYKDNVWCDVVSMDACHLLLGRPWEYDHAITHNGRANTYSFLFEGVMITLMPNKPKEIVRKEVAEDSEIPKTMIPLLEEVFDVFHDELLDALLPLCDIQHHIDLEPSSQLPTGHITYCALESMRSCVGRLKNSFLMVTFVK
uniref:Putative reverse transcriptase domain-containing protein n=1 Tax=Tanacetum cinerariifolium TaxID=118510 RepID=A0A699I748_TANCI|nr:putative reverse transcriptase domain-containing protein [Tanacetum cinerariifolium]